jgi:hypothetical protein
MKYVRGNCMEEHMWGIQLENLLLIHIGERERGGLLEKGKEGAIVGI